MQMKKRPLLVSFALLSMLWLGQSGYSQEKKLERLILATSTVGLGRIPILVAQEQRLFQKHGLEVNIVYIRGSSTSLQSLLAGEVQLVVGGGQGTIGAAARGAPVVIISNFSSTPNQLVALPPITSIGQLKGKIIGASRPGTSTDFVLDRLLPRLGLIPGKDVKLLPTGLLVSEERLALLLQKRVDATLANQESVSQFQRKGHPLNVLADALAYSVNSTIDFSTSRQFLTTQRTQLKAFIKAVSEGIWLAKIDKEIAFRVMLKQLKVDPRFLESTHTNYVVRLHPEKPYPIRESLEAAIEDMTPAIPELKGKKPSDFADSSLVAELDKEGFFEQLKR
ncbi:MAG: ABC transporter substrate-binding protein [Deltaproteobacteria bacterium]|nr:ABC transporter substrate-binding protein [Deltaproteobacteria bacterium]